MLYEAAQQNNVHSFHLIRARVLSFQSVLLVVCYQLCVVFCPVGVHQLCITQVNNATMQNFKLAAIVE